MTQSGRLASLLSDPELSGFALLVEAGAEGPALSWVVELASTAEADEVLSGDLVLARTTVFPKGESAIEALCSLLKKRGAAAIAVEAPADPHWLTGLAGSASRHGLGLLTWPETLAPSLAARILASSLVALSPESGGTRQERRTGQPATGVAAQRRILALAASGAGSGLDRQVARALLEPVLPFGVAVEAEGQRDKSLVFLQLRIDPQARSAELREGLRAAAAEHHLSIGVSDLLGNSDLADEGQARAREALELGKALLGPGQVAYYDNLYLYKAFIDDGRPELLLSFSRSTLDRIRDSDRRKGEDLLGTLEVYFDLDRNLRKTAEALGIHRHTLRSRLARIEELTSCPMEGEGRMSYELVLAYKHLSKVKL